MSTGNITAQEANYLKSCESVIADLENHVSQCCEELQHHQKMAEYAEKQKSIARGRLALEKKSLKEYRASLGLAGC